MTERLALTERSELEERARWVRRETLLLHKRAPETRLASSLSAVEILVALFYGGVLRHDPANPLWAGRDRFIVSKGHGSISFYPVLADRGYFSREELQAIGRPNARLGVIPDNTIPGYETNNGSLGHGLGVACGVALALKQRNAPERVVVLCGDGEMNSGAVWEAVMFAAFHRLDHLILIVDDNKMSMLGRQKDILGLNPLEDKLRAFGWAAERVAGHDAAALRDKLAEMKLRGDGRPSALVADTVKGRGVPALEQDPLCHIRSLRPEEIDRLVAELQ